MTVDINTTLFLIDPITSSIQQFVHTLEILVGGVFGIYLIIVILKWIEERRMKKIFTMMHNELERINIQLSGINDKLIKVDNDLGQSSQKSRKKSGKRGKKRT